MKIVRKILVLLVVQVIASGYSLTSQAAPAAEKEWTFLLFLNGHNNLSSFGDMNIKDMEKSGSNDHVNLVVEWGQTRDNINRRMLIQKSTDPSKVTSPSLMNIKDVDMGDYKNLVEFVRWGAENFPAKHYFVAVWNHGSGWNFQDLKIKSANNQVMINDISYDDNSGNHITTEELGLAMNQIKQIIGRNVDIYGSDACLMQMIEVANEMKDSINYFVGSQDLEPGEGWPYETFMKAWTQKPMSSPAEVSVLLSKEYLKSYSRGGVYGVEDVTFSALDISKLNDLNSSVARLVTHLKSLDAASIKKIKMAAANSQEFYTSDFKDLGDFLKRVEALPIRTDKDLFAQVKGNLASLILTTDNSSPQFAAATGLSIWIPAYKSSDMQRYSGLAFDRITQWSSLLATFNGQ
jgi:hypothetical protein